MIRRRWVQQPSMENVEAPEVDAFIEELVAVCRRHGYSIAHEDGHGAFVVEPYSESNAEWLREALLATWPLPRVVAAIRSEVGGGD